MTSIFSTRDFVGAATGEPRTGLLEHGVHDLPVVAESDIFIFNFLSFFL